MRANDPRELGKEAQKRTLHAARFLPSSTYRLRLDLKPTIKRVPRTLTEGSAAETPKHRNGDLEFQIGGGKLRWSAAGVISYPSNVSSIDISMKRE